MFTQTFTRAPLEAENPAICRAFAGTATGIRTPVSAVRGRRPSPLDDGGSAGGIVAAGLGLPLALPRGPASEDLVARCGRVRGAFRGDSPAGIQVPRGARARRQGARGLPWAATSCG